MIYQFIKFKKTELSKIKLKGVVLHYRLLNDIGIITGKKVNFQWKVKDKDGKNCS